MTPPRHETGWTESPGPHVRLVALNRSEVRVDTEDRMMEGSRAFNERGRPTFRGR